jgi:hypothetical protein
VGAEFAGKPVVDPRDVLRACRELRLPTEDWAGLPTSFRTSTRVPGYGYILLTRKDLNAIPETESHSMKLEHNGKSLTFKRIWIKESRCITPSFEKDEESVYLCTIVDYRNFMRSIPANAIYNLRDASGSLNTASLNGGSQWTWSGMLGNLWAKSGELGTFPGLPSGLSPHGNPNHFDYSTWSLWDAILHTCDRLGLAFVYDPFADKYSLTRVGSSAPRWPTPSSFVWDDYVLAGDNANEPNEIKTQFRRLPVAATGEPTFTKTVSRTGKTGILAGSAVLLADDLTASVSTDSALTSRASDRAAEWERIKPTDYAKGTITIFVGLHDLTASHLGKRIESVAWVDRGCDSTDFGDSGGGWTTEAKAGSIGFYEEWEPTGIDDSEIGPRMVQITSATRDSNGFYPANLMAFNGTKFTSIGEVRFRGNDDTKCAVGENFDVRFIGTTGSFSLFAGTGNADLVSSGVWSGGLVSINAQEFKGEKTFRDAIIIEETSTASELFVRGASALAKIGQSASGGAYTSMFAGASVLQHDYVQSETLRARIFAGETVFGKAAYITFPSTGIGAAAGASGEFNGYGSFLLNGFGFYSHSGTIVADPGNEEGHSSKFGVTRTKEGAVWGIDAKGKLNGPLGSSISITVRGGIVSELDVVAEAGAGFLNGVFNAVGVFP